MRARSIRRLLAVLSLLVVAQAGAAKADTAMPYDWRLPPGIAPPPVPADNPMSDAKVELGRHLFFDARLSASGYTTCGHCHLPARAFSDIRSPSILITGERHPRDTPGLANVGYFRSLGWARPDMTSLEAHAELPLFGREHILMQAAGREAEILERLQVDLGSRRRFAAAFPERDGAIDFTTIRMALAAFQRSLVSFASAYDQDRMSPAATRGAALFEDPRLGCAECHRPPLFTDADTPTGARYHNTGLYNLDGRGGVPAANPGLAAATGDPADRGRFRTPSLRNVAVTAPYMHDGSVASLAEVVAHYAAGGRAAQGGDGGRDGSRSPLASPLVPGFAITPAETADLVAFLEALTDEAFLTDPRHRTPYVWEAGMERESAGESAP